MTLPKADALQEIEVRAGDPAGANWTMRTAPAGLAVFEIGFPSGVDELVMFGMKQENGAWKIASLRTLAELSPEERQNAKEAPLPDTELAELKARWHRRAAWVAILAMVLAMIGASVRHRFRRISSAVLLLSFFTFAAHLVVIVSPGLMTVSPAHILNQRRGSALPFAQLRELLPLRRAVNRGTMPPTVHVTDPEVAATARLWRAQIIVDTAATSDATLAGAPLATLLHARALADAGNPSQARTAYATFRTHIPSPDAFWLEQLMTENPLANRSAGKEELTRDAGVYYMQTMFDVMRGKDETARENFRQAWRMQPLSRQTLVRAGFFASLLRDPMVSMLVNLNTPEESRTADVALGRAPMRVPPDAKSSASGTFVRIEIGHQQLDMPGGADIAPRGTEIVPATEWDRREEKAALEDFEQLSKSHLSTPGARFRANRTAEALIEHSRWSDVLKLTDSITTDAGTVPLGLLVARVRALLRLHRGPEAKALAKSPAVGRSLQQHDSGAGSLITLAELLTQAGAYDDAIDIYRKVESMKHAPDIAPRVRQAELRRSLAVSTPVITTEHFEIHCMPDVPPTVAERVGQLLEAELTRVMARIHLAQFARVRVNILNWSDFSSRLTGSADILGFYDGDITIPFGGVESFRQDIVAILTHEMTHAVIAQASDDNTPHWFQEGLATRMELVERQENIFQNRTHDQLTTIAVLDDELEAEADLESVSDAYVESATFIRFLEERYGPESVNSMIAAYRTGATTDEAFVTVTKKNTVDLDREFRDWGFNHSEAFVDKTPWPYLQFYSLGIDPKVRDAIHWSRRPAVKP